MAILVLGGAGYIGSHMVKLLTDQKEEVIVLDNLETGNKESIEDKEVQFYLGDVRDEAVLDQIFDNHDIDSVVHFAAYSLVPESIKDPLKYFSNNVSGMISLLSSMARHNVNTIVFSSTAAVYGIPEKIPIKECDNENPISPYGLSKLMMEQIVEWANQAYGINYIGFRYFNVAGADKTSAIGEAHKVETHLIPKILESVLAEKEAFEVTGVDYETKDGTNIRDYIHVSDIASAHYSALNYLRSGGESDIFNLGSESGFSVREIIDAARKVTGHPIPTVDKGRRGGDPDILIANSDKAEKILGWVPEYTSIEDIISTAWNWHKKHPNGYENRSNQEF